jgi:hypothetical protein
MVGPGGRFSNFRLRAEGRVGAPEPAKVAEEPTHQWADHIGQSPREPAVGWVEESGADELTIQAR